MDETFDREKIIDCMFDPITSEILAKLEDGKKMLFLLNNMKKLQSLEMMSWNKPLS